MNKSELYTYLKTKYADKSFDTKITNDGIDLLFPEFCSYYADAMIKLLEDIKGSCPAELYADKYTLVIHCKIN